MLLSDNLRREDNFIRLYKFTCSLPKEQSYMLSYLIDAEAFVTEQNNDVLPDDSRFFHVNKDGFISNLLTGWSVKEINTAIRGLEKAGYIEVRTENIKMRKGTYIRLVYENIKRLIAEYTKGKLPSVQKGDLGDTKKDISQYTKGELINNNNKEQVLKTNNKRDNKEYKNTYGEYNHVILNDSDYIKLKEDIPNLEQWIRKVDEYCQMTGKSYKDYNLVIRNWSRKEFDDKKKKNPAEPILDYEESKRKREQDLRELGRI